MELHDGRIYYNSRSHSGYYDKTDRYLLQRQGAAVGQTDVSFAIRELHSVSTTDSNSQLRRRSAGVIRLMTRREGAHPRSEDFSRHRDRQHRSYLPTFRCARRPDWPQNFGGVSGRSSFRAIKNFNELSNFRDDRSDESDQEHALLGTQAVLTNLLRSRSPRARSEIALYHSDRASRPDRAIL